MGHKSRSEGGRPGARVLAWRPPRPPAAPGVHPPAVPRTGPDDPEQEATQRLSRLVSETLGENHAVDCLVERGGPVQVLLKASRDADLLVVDSPRQDKPATMSAKLVAPRLIYRSACPVVVMPPSPGEAGRAAASLRRATSRFAAAFAESAGTAGRAGLPPIPRQRPNAGPAE